MTIFVHIDVDFALNKVAIGPSEGNLKFMFKFTDNVNKPNNVELDHLGNITIGQVPLGENVDVTFHLSGEELEWDGKIYVMNFIVGVGGSAKDLLWISKDANPPTGPWDGGDGFRKFSYNLDGTKSSVGVTIDKSRLPRGWKASYYCLAVNVRRKNSYGYGVMVRHDPQIKN